MSVCTIGGMKFHKKNMSEDILKKCNSSKKTCSSSTPMDSTSSNPVLPSESVNITPPPLTSPHLTRSPLLSLDLGEKFLDNRLKILGLRRCPGQIRTPRDGNCGPHAIVYQFSTNSDYCQTNMWRVGDHLRFRQMMTMSFSVQVQQGINWYFEQDINRYALISFLSFSNMP